MIDDTQQRGGRVLFLRLESAQPLIALSPAWAALCGLLASSGMGLDERTLVLSVLVLLLVEPVMGGLRVLLHRPSETVGHGGGEIAASAADPIAADPIAIEPVLPYGRTGSAAHRLVSAVADGHARWRRRQGPAGAVAANLAFALVIGSLLGPAPALVVAAVAVLLASRRWRTGALAMLLRSAYDVFLPWLIGLLALGQVAEHGFAPFLPLLALALLSSVIYVAFLALAGGLRWPALLVLDAAQVAVLGMLLQQRETLAVWFFGLCLIGQLAAHPALLGGGRVSDDVRRASLYVALGMLVAVIALAPALPGG